MFGMRDASKPLHSATLGVWSKELSKVSGVDGLTPHALRRTYGQTLIDRGVSVDSVSLMLGHDSTVTTENYYCRKDAGAARQEALKAFDEPSAPHPQTKRPSESIIPGLTPELTGTGSLDALLRMKYLMRKPFAGL